MATVDSKLATEFIESPNHRNGRLYPITRITIHHAAMVCNARVVANVFVPAARKASATYCIGNDGGIVQCVKESDMPWTSSNSDNDNRAITIEVANSARYGQWPISDAAMESLINLCVDICERNPGIGRLNYTGDTNGNLTMHCWFTNTQCPGPYLKSKFGYIAEEVNKRLDAKNVSTKTVYDIEVKGVSKDLVDRIAAEVSSEGGSAVISSREIEIIKPVENTSGYTKIASNPVATAEQMIAYVKAKNPNVAQSVIGMIPLYLSEGKTEGIAGCKCQ